MNTSPRIRIILMSLVALVVFGFASVTFAKSFPFRKIEFKYSDGTTNTVDINSTGGFTYSGPLKAGTYSFSLIKGSLPMQASSQTATDNGQKPKISTSSGNDYPMESLTVSKITLYLHVTYPPDPASGSTTGKRQHSPVVIVKEWEPSSPKLFSKAVPPTVPIGTGKIDEDCNGISGKILMSDAQGKLMTEDSWSAPSK